jgi:hypothetical protein
MIQMRRPRIAENDGLLGRRCVVSGTNTQNEYT